MNCDECRQLTEAYFDGELDLDTADSITMHLAACAACADALCVLEDEAEFYKNYERDIEVSPALWTTIETRLNAKTNTLRARIYGLIGRLNERLSSRLAGAVAFPRFASGAPAAVSVCLIVIAALFINQGENVPPQQVVNVNNQTEQLTAFNQPTVAAVETKEREYTQETVNQVSPGKLSQTKSNLSHIQTSFRRSSATKRPVVQGKRESSSEVLAETRRRIVPQNPSQLSPEDTIEMFAAAAQMSIQSNEVRSGFDDAWQRHAEQSQMLLRSFRNARISSGAVVDVAYESAQARRLLGRNIILRRDATRRGRVIAEDVLSRLEPVLLDIANLPKKTSPGEVRTVKARINEGELVSTLHIQSTLLARAN